MEKSTSLSCGNLACSCCNTMRYEVSQLETKLSDRIKQEPNAHIRRLSAEGEVHELQQQNARLVECLKQMSNLVSPTAEDDDLETILDGMIQQTLAEVRGA